MKLDSILNEYTFRNDPAKQELARQAITLMHFSRSSAVPGLYFAQFPFSGRLYRVVMTRVDKNSWRRSSEDEGALQSLRSQTMKLLTYESAGELCGMSKWWIR